MIVVRDSKPLIEDFWGLRPVNPCGLFYAKNYPIEKTNSFVG